MPGVLWPVISPIGYSVTTRSLLPYPSRFGGSGRPQFYDLLRGTRAPSYIAFDIVWLNGVDLRKLPLSERRQQLQAVLPRGSAIVSELVSVIGRGCELFDMMVAHGRA